MMPAEFSIDSPLEYSEWPNNYLSFLHTIEQYIQAENDVPDYGLCKTIPIYSPEFGTDIGKPMSAIWTPDYDIQEIAFIEQCVAFNNIKGTHDIPGFDYFKNSQMFYQNVNKGQQDAAVIFEHCRRERHAFLSAFVMATLFEVIDGRHSHRESGFWSRSLDRSVFLSIQEVYALSKQHVKKYFDYFPWDHKNTQVLPINTHWNNIFFENLHGLATFMAVHLSLLVSKFRIVVPVKAEQPYAGFETAYKHRQTKAEKERLAEKKAQHEFSEQLRKTQVEQEKQRAKEEVTFKNEYHETIKKIKELIHDNRELPDILAKNDHLRNHWGLLSTYELETLVWTAPLTMIGELFGISDNAVRKAAKKEGIVLPKAGFWNRVRSGKVPHPNGIPVLV